jgi:hypothetical protein
MIPKKIEKPIPNTNTKKIDNKTITNKIPLKTVTV